MDREKARTFRLLTKKGSYDEAFALARDMFQEFMAAENLQGASQALVWLCHIADLMGKPSAANRYQREFKALCLRKRSKRAYTLFLMARFQILLARGQIRDAEAYIKEMAEKSALLARAEIAMARGETGLARDLIREYGSPDTASFMVEARLLVAMGKLDEAVGLLIKKAIQDPALEIVRKSVLGFALVSQGKHQEALRYLNEVIEETRHAHGIAMEMGDALASLAVIWANNRDTDRAILYLDMAETSSLKVGGMIRVMEIRALKEAIAPRAEETLRVAMEMADQAAQKGFGAAGLWSLWAAAQGALDAGLEEEAGKHITSCLEKATQNDLWGYISYIAQAAPEPLRLALRLYPKHQRLKQVAKLVPGISGAHDRIRLNLFGGPSVDTPQGRFPLKKDRAGEMILYFALKNNKRLTREDVIREFWPDLPEKRGRRNYYKFISIARAFLREHGVSLKSAKRRDTADLGCEISTDLDELEGLIRAAEALSASSGPEGARSFYERALFMINRDFLEAWPGSSLSYLSDYRRWAEETAALVRMRMARYLLSEDPQKALALSERVLSHDPFSEEACEIGLRALVAMRMLEKAKALYEGFRENFVRELKMEPKLRWPPESE